MLISTRWESYLTRRVPISTTGMTRILAAQTRLNAIRELMRMEMPERDTDILFSPSAQGTVPDWHIPTWYELKDANGITQGIFSVKRPALAASYYRRYLTSTPPPTTDYSSAEFLYLWVTRAIPDAKEQFRENEMADADGDGWPEFVDGWGNPIKFIRWSPALRSSDG